MQNANAPFPIQQFHGKQVQVILVGGTTLDGGLASSGGTSVTVGHWTVVIAHIAAIKLLAAG